MSPSKFFVKLKDFWQPEEFDTEEQATDAWREYSEKGEEVEAWEETEEGELKDLFTGEKIQ